MNLPETFRTTFFRQFIELWNRRNSTKFSVYRIFRYISDWKFARIYTPVQNTDSMQLQVSQIPPLIATQLPPAVFVVHRCPRHLSQERLWERRYLFIDWQSVEPSERCEITRNTKKKETEAEEEEEEEEGTGRNSSLRNVDEETCQGRKSEGKDWIYHRIPLVSRGNRMPGRPTTFRVVVTSSTEPDRRRYERKSDSVRCSIG